VQIPRPNPVSIPPIIELGENPHSARCSAGAELPATSCLGAFWTPVS
jgi:hypothetical protein